MKIDHKDSYKDFGKQFQKDKNVDGYWGSIDMLKDIVSPFQLSNIKNKKIMEVGIGSGRILKNLISFFPSKATGIEPSNAIDVAKKNIDSKNVEFLNIKGENINFNEEYDFIFSLGVIHHIPNYEVVLKNIHKSLKKNGEFIIWVYGKEGNEMYLFIFNNLRRITILIPDFVLRILSYILNIVSYLYEFLCNFFPLPLKKYFLEVFGKCSFEKRNYIIFDQLNPSYSKYFTKEELLDVLQKTGFKDITTHHRHGYSWTAIAKKI
jgi:SAM-dependent methyltransferase